MLPTNAVRHRPSITLDLLEFDAVYNESEILRRLKNCKILIGHQARLICDQWTEAKRNKETQDLLQDWMVGRPIAVIGQNQMLQIMCSGRLVDVMPGDLAEKVSYAGLGYVFTVVRDGDIVKISSLTDTLTHR